MADPQQSPRDEARPSRLAVLAAAQCELSVVGHDLQAAEVRALGWALQLSGAEGGLIARLGAAGGFVADAVGSAQPLQGATLPLDPRAEQLKPEGTLSAEPSVWLGPAATLRAGARSLLLVPLPHQEQLTSLLAVTSSRPGAFTEDDRQALALLAGLLAAQGRANRAAAAHHLVIDERNQALRALRLAEDEIATTLGGIADGIVTIDPLGKVRRINLVAQRLLGCREAEAVGRPLDEVLQLLDPNTRSRMPSAAAKLLAGPEASLLPQEALLVSPGGRTLPVEDRAAPLWGAAGEMRGVVTLLRDVTQDRCAREYLERSQREFRRLIEMIPDGIAIRFKGQIIYSNPSLDRALGYGPGELVGRAMLDLIDPQERTLAQDRMTLADRGEFDRCPPLELRFLRKAGGTAALEVAPIAEVEFHGFLGTLIVARDVSERNRLQEKLAQADRLASLGRLAAGVAHEINNPLAFVTANLGYLGELLPQLAASDAALVQEAQGVLEETAQGCERIRVVVRDLHVFARVGEKRGAVDLHQVLDLSINMAANQIRHRARLARNFGPLPKVLGSDARLGQVFLNLLVNAAQAIPEGSVDQNLVEVVTFEQGGRAVVEIRDTGHGIPQVLVPRIFDPFFTTKAVGAGMGLGLSICHAIVTEHGGEIAVQSVAGQGTVFRISLPAAPPEAQQVAALPAPPKQSGRRGQVFVIDDDPGVLNALRRSLGRHHDVRIFADAREALARLAAGEPCDVVLCDLMMPRMTGMDLHRELLALRPALARSAIFLSGGAFTDSAREFLETVDNARMGKPFDLPELLRLIAARLADGGTAVTL